MSEVSPKQSSTNPKELLDEENLKIEKGEFYPPEESLLYPKGVMDVLRIVFKSRKYPRPRGKQSPTFSVEEIKTIVEFLFFKPPYITLKVYKRVPRKKEMPIKRISFINYFLSDANFNAAKAARMAGYSPRSAKQIAYKIKQT